MVCLLNHIHAKLNDETNVIDGRGLFGRSNASMQDMALAA